MTEPKLTLVSSSSPDWRSLKWCDRDMRFCPRSGCACGRSEALEGITRPSAGEIAEDVKRNPDLFSVPRADYCEIDSPSYYRNLLRARNDRWRRACIDRGLDPDREREKQIRISIYRESYRHAAIQAKESWLSKILGRFFR